MPAVGSLVVGCSGDGDELLPEADPAEGVPVAIAEEPSLTLGVAAGDTLQEFGQLRTPFLSPDGRVVIPLGIAQEIRIFDSDGQFLQRLGGPGEGPGEFARLAGAWLRGDTIEAYDWGLARITRFFPDGEFETVQLIDPPAPNLQPIPGGPQPAGGWLLQAYGPVVWDRRDRMFVERYRMDGTYVDRVADVEGMLRRRAPGLSGPGPLSPMSKLALHAGRVYMAETLTPRIQVFDTTGVVVRSIEWEPERSYSPEEARGIIEDSVLAAASPEEAPALRIRLSYYEERDDFVSTFAGFLVDELGFVWVQPFDPRRHSTAFSGSSYGGWSPGGEWRVFSPEGAEVGSVVVPDDLDPVQLTSDAVLGIRTDVLGVETVQVHALERR